MRSKASQKFNNLHPESHQQFQNIFKTAKLKKIEEYDQFNSSIEILNMVKNISLTRFREEDDVVSKPPRQRRNKVSKKLSWSKNLIEVQLLWDWRQFSCLAIEN